MPLTTWILSRHWHVSPLGFVPQKPPGHFPSLLYFHLPSCMSLPFRIFSQVLTKEAHPHTSVLSPPFMCHYEYIISWVTGTQTSLGEKKEIIAQWLSKGESEKKKKTAKPRTLHSSLVQTGVWHWHCTLLRFTCPTIVWDHVALSLWEPWDGSCHHKF